MQAWTKNVKFRHISNEYSYFNFRNIVIIYIFWKYNVFDYLLLSTLLRDGADNLTPFGMFLAISCRLTLFIKFFSLVVAVLSFKNRFKQVFDALPRFVFPGVNFNLNLVKKNSFSLNLNTYLKPKLLIVS